MYRALRRRRGLSKEAAARTSNARTPGHTVKDSGVADLAIPPHGPNALFNQPSIAQRRRKKQKAVCTCKAQQIAPGVTRIRGNLCNVHGRYGRCPGGAAAAKPRQPTKTPEQRMADRAAAREQNVTKTLDALGMPEDAADSLKRLAAGEAVDDDGGLVKMGLAEQAKDGSYRLTAAGRAVMHAAGRGDLGAARDAQSAAADRAAVAATKPEKPKKGGGGGGGGKKKPTDEEKRAAQDEKKAKWRHTTAPMAGLSTEEADWLAGVASGTPPAGSFDGRHLAELGLTQDAGDTTEATSAGRQLLRALERGDARGALAAVQDGKARLARDRARAEQRRRREQERQQRKKKKEWAPIAQIRMRFKAQSDQEKAMFAAMGGGRSGGGGGKGGGGGAAKEPTLWNKNPQTGKREASMGLVHENLFGASYTKRQQELQAAGGIEAMLNKPKKGREQFFQEQTAAVSHQTPLPKITTAKPAPTASAAHGLSKPERYHELEGLTERTKMPQAGWNAPMSDKQGGYLGSLLDRAKLNTKEGGEARQLANDLIAAAKAGKLTKWEASKLIDAMQRPKPFSTLLEQARTGVRDGNSESPWRALLAIPSFRTALINHTLNREAGEEGLPF